MLLYCIFYLIIPIGKIPVPEPTSSKFNLPLPQMQYLPFFLFSLIYDSYLIFAGGNFLIFSNVSLSFVFDLYVLFEIFISLYKLSEVKLSLCFATQSVHTLCIYSNISNIAFLLMPKLTSFFGFFLNVRYFFEFFFLHPIVGSINVLIKINCINIDFFLF